MPSKSKREKSPAAPSLYELLRVETNADSAVIRKAYYALARKVHPDKNPDNPDAAANFRALQSAYEVLSDADRRAQYDRTGLTGEAADAADAFRAAYEHYKSVEITPEDIEAAEESYRGSADETADITAYFLRHAGDISHILAFIIGSRDEDIDRYVAAIEVRVTYGRLSTTPSCTNAAPPSALPPSLLRPDRPSLQTAASSLWLPASTRRGAKLSSKAAAAC